ncbi:MAG: hypothetical protein WC890_03190 [Candidatus Margulisiibacteriota bacterium]
MSKIRLAKFDQTYLQIWRGQNREKASAIREKALTSAKTGTSLLPIIAEQHDFIVGGINQALKGITEPSIDILDEKVMVLVSGSIARLSCVPGSDIDLDVTYPDSERSRFLPLEKALFQNIRWLFEFPQERIGTNVHSHISHTIFKRFPPKMPIIAGLRKFGWRSGIAHIIRRSLFHCRALEKRLRGKSESSAFLERAYFQLFQLERRLAFREFGTICSGLLERYSEKQALSLYNFDTPYNIENIFGPSERFLAYIEQRESAVKAISQGRLRGIAINLQRQGHAHRNIASSLPALNDLYDFHRQVKHDILINFYYLLTFEKMVGIDLLGADREKAFEAYQMLLRIKAVMNILSQPKPTLAPCDERMFPITDPFLQSTAVFFGCHSKLGLFNLITQESDTLLQIIEAAYNRYLAML